MKSLLDSFVLVTSSLLDSFSVLIERPMLFDFGVLLLAIVESAEFPPSRSDDESLI